MLIYLDYIINYSLTFYKENALFFSQKKFSHAKLRKFYISKYGLVDGIWTHNLVLPKHAHYQIVLLLDEKIYFSLISLATL